MQRLGPSLQAHAGETASSRTLRGATVADGAGTAVPRGLLSQGSRFAVVGVLCTAVYLLVLTTLRDLIGIHGANLVALVVALLLDTVVSRTLTHRGVGPLEDPRLLVATSRALGPALVLTAGSLLALHALAAAPPRDLELVVLVAANAVAALLRFATLRRGFPWGARHR